MMKDKNNVVIEIGDIVKIENSPIKSDNATYVVAQDGTSKSYSSTDLTLYKVAKHKGGYSLSRSSYNICFYPLHNYSSKYHYTIEEMNAVTIEVLIKADSNKFDLVKSDDKYENEETEQTYFRAEIKKDNERIEDVSYSADEKEKMIAFFSNITLKQGETIEICKQDYSWGYYYRNINYKLESYQQVEEVKEEVITAEPEQISEEQPTQEVKEDIQPLEAIEETKQNETMQEQPQQQEITTTIERKYFHINEQLAKTSQSLWSFNDYIPNSATEGYKREVEKDYKIVDRIAIEKPNRLQDALSIAERYSKAYAEWINKGYSIEMMCPSVMICGAGNFPVRKKEKQNNARDKHMKDFEYINGYLQKLENILHGNEIIKSGDKDAIEKLTEKLKQLEESQELMKQVNAYYRKYKTLDGCDLLSQKNINAIKDLMIRIPYHTQPFASYELTNNNASINATKQRLEALQKVKEEGTKESIQSSICKVVENSELMRIQLLFDSIPDVEIRNILKSNGFKWSPSNKAWQRQLTDNARYSTKKVIEQLEKLSA